MVNLPTPIQKLSHPLLHEKRIQLYVKRDDLTHPEIMGNKWRKLKYNLEAAKEGGFKGIITLGGAFSNHIAATAAAAKENGLCSIGIIRGEELSKGSNPTLKLAAENGMELRFVSRADYRRLKEDPGETKSLNPEYYFLPEGGTNQLAIKGCKEIVLEIQEEFDIIISPIGTGGTLCGLIDSLKDHQKAIGIASLKGDFMQNEIQKLLSTFDIHSDKYEVNTSYHFGGYAKTTQELIDFINWFKENFHISLDPVYTGKSFFAVWDMIKKDKFVKNLRIVLLHTGGLQGISGFNRKNEFILQ